MIAILQRFAARVMRRQPDFLIGGAEAPYLRRWYVTPWSGWYRSVPRAQMTWWQHIVTRLPCLYVHEILRSDDDRALHDHPWVNVSVILKGGYIEHTIRAGGVHVETWRGAGTYAFRRAGVAHRLEVAPGTSAVTVFFTGPRIRDWGFHCPRGWVPWRQFVAKSDHGTIGAGCGDTNEGTKA